VTTREVLGLPGEEIVALAPLAPDEAIELFTQRARVAKPAFEPGAEDAAAIARLVRLLDGLPLAIELAAARVRVMPPRTLVARMSERFKLLATSGGRIDRQATLRAVFDWSWDLLSLAEKAALAQLSVFEGGFSLEAVEAVLDLSAFENAPWTLDVLQSLVQKSLVRSAPHDRFELLVSIQEYAAEHLRTEQRFAGSGAAAQRAAEARHGMYFANLDEQAATAHACADLDNLVAACRRAAARGDVDVAARALERAWSALRLRGPFRAGIELAAVVEPIARSDPAAAARVNRVAGGALDACGRYADACDRLRASIEAARAVGDGVGECRARIALGGCLREIGSLEASRTELDAALALAAALDDANLQGRAHNNLGSLEVGNGRRAEACKEYEQALLLTRRGGDRRMEAGVLGNLGMLHADMGASEQARRYYEAALRVAQEVGDRKVEGNTLCNIGLFLFLEGNFTEARGQLQAALAVSREIGNAHLECVTLCNLGIVHEYLDELDDAQSNLERALAIARELGHKRSEGQVLGYLARVHARRENVVDARRCLDAGDALVRAVSDSESLGIILAIRAEIEQRAGDADGARAALVASETLAADIAPGANSEWGLALARARKSVAR
jgi:tetratricopeptide (TPR) repeat protein